MRRRGEAENPLATEPDPLSSFRWSLEGATDDAIEAAESTLGSPLPHDYRSVLREHDGGEGWVGDGAYLRLWPIAEVVTKHEQLDPGQLVPGVLLIGSDGGGEVYGIDMRTAAYKRYPAIGLGPELGIELGKSWDAFLAALARME